MPREFIQLTSDNCTYLLELIEDMDSETLYTEKQRSYTVPKLTRILDDPYSTRLAYQDVDYLLDLIEDDDLPQAESARESAKTKLLKIQELQASHMEQIKDIDYQREARRFKRLSKEVPE